MILENYIIHKIVLIQKSLDLIKERNICFKNKLEQLNNLKYLL